MTRRVLVVVTVQEPLDRGKPPGHEGEVLTFALQ